MARSSLAGAKTPLPTQKEPAERSAGEILLFQFISRENSVDLARVHAHLLAARYLKNR